MDWKSRIRGLFTASAANVDEDVIEELSEHAAAAYERMLSDGSEATEAARHVAELVQSWAREAPNLRRRSNRPPAVEASPVLPRRFAGFLNDVRYALRMLNRQRAFAVLSISTMSIGIGICTSLFSVVYGVFWKPLPWPEPDRIIRLTEIRQGATRPHPLQIDNAAYLAWQDDPTTIEKIGGFWTNTATVSGVGDASRIGISHVTSSIFSIVRAKPLMGSLFTPDEEDASGKVLLSYGFWHERLGGRSDALGRIIQIDGNAFTIIGVMPREFVFPDTSVRVWIPYHIRPVIGPDGHGTNSQIFNAIARLRPGVTPKQAASEATARARSAPDGGLATLAFWGAEPNARIDISAAPALDALTSDVRPALLAVTAAVILLFLAVVGNVANLRLAHTVSRQREIAIRSSIGAGVQRIAQQLLIESVVLGFAGGVTGLLTAVGLHRALPSWLPSDFPRIDDVAFNLRVAVFCGLLTLVTGLVLGALPAFQVRRLNLVESLTEDQNRSIGGRKDSLPRARIAIMIGQIAIACILLVGALLLSRSLLALMHADRGYDPTNLVTAIVSMPVASFSAQREIDVLNRMVERVGTIPSVTLVAYTDGLPLSSNETLSAFKMPSNRPPVGAPMQVHSVRHVVSENYFQTFGMRVLKGRAFSSADTASSQHVVVVNRAFAKQYLSDSVIGDRIINFAGDFARGEFQVVGVIDDVVEHQLSEGIQPEIYSLQTQSIFRSQNPGIVIRTNGDARAIVDLLRSIAKEQDPSLALYSVMTMEERLSSSLSKPRFYAVLLGAFAFSALLITAVGLFGVLSYTVSQRKREFALRSALGATPADLVRLILKNALTMTLCGLAAGTFLSFVLVTYLDTLLYGIKAHDWVSFAAVEIIIIIMSVLACVGPALRTLRIDPIRSLGGH
jgi:putative ABC transport system permease protein